MNTLIKRFFGLFFLPLFVFNTSYCQMNFQGESLYGNEWIDFDKTYVKFTIDEDNLYRITYNQLSVIGFPNDIKGREIQLYSFGKQIPIYTSTPGTFGPQDYVEFVGLKNTGELDAVLFEDADAMQLNPKYSMFSDERPYYLTWEPNSSNNPRIESLTNDLSGNLPNVEPYYLAKEEVVYSDFHMSPVKDNQDVKYSSFYFSEGYGSSLSRSFDLPFETDNFAANGPFPRVNLRLGSTGGSHTLNIRFNNKFLMNEVFTDYKVFDLSFDLNIDDINQNNSLKINGNQGNFDRYSIAYASLEYPRTFNANNESTFKFNLKAHSFPKYFEIENFASTSNRAILIDVKNNVRLLADTENNKAKFLLPRADVDREVWLVNIFASIDNFQTVNFVDYLQLDPEYVILTSKEMDAQDENGQNWIQNYSDYRSSAYSTSIVHAEDIIEQFGYGLVNNPQAINNWSQYLRDKWTDWKYAFIMGKAYEYSTLRKEDFEGVSHVPTFGEPGSDNLLFATPGTPYPIVALGRIAAKDKSQLKLYYDKVLIYEDQSTWGQTIEEKAWMKNIIHLSGGDATIENILSGYLDNFEDIVDTSLFAGNVTKFKKSSSNPIQNSLSQSIIDKVNEGASLITFFGHSAVGTFDFSIEDPSKFDNYNKLPMIVSLGCHSGNIHTNAEGISEDFVLFPERGSICFYASSGTAYINPQFDQGSDFYRLFSNDMYGKEIGTILLEALKANPNTSYHQETLYEQLTLHGDPVLKLNPQEGPDYIPDFSSINIEPEVISTNIDSLTLNFDFVNIGTANYDTLEYYIIHSYGNNSDTLKFTTNSYLFREQISKSIPLYGLNTAGKNTIQIVLDPNNRIPEFPNPAAELNNSLNSNNGEEGYCFYVVNDNPVPFYPVEFSITNDEVVNLKAATGNAFVGTKDYEIQIDTTELFNSSLLQSETLTVTGGLIEWTPTFNYQDEKVYYWRVRSLSAENENAGWNYSSFIHIDEYEDGWNQSHFYQYQKDDFATLQIDSMSRDFDFVKDLYEVRLKNVVRAGDESPEFRINGSLTDAYYLGTAAFNAGVAVIAIDPNSILPLVCVNDGSFGNDTPVFWDERNSWRFKTDTPQERAEIIDFLQNGIPNDHYVIFLTLQRENTSYLPEEWENELFQALENEGAQSIRELQNGAKPYMLAYQKGAGLIREFVSNSSEDVLDEIVSIDGKWFEGNMYSTKIGPASKWNKLLWNVSEIESDDDFRISLYGVTPEGIKDTLVASVQNTQYDLSAINANDYPCLQLEYYITDNNSKTAPDLDFWRVVYDPIPEAVLNIKENFSFKADTLQKGDELSLNFQIDNVSSANMDSMLVHYTIINKDNNEVVYDQRRSPIQAEKSILSDFTLETSELNGRYDLRVEINPDKDQPEQYDFNNVGILRFFVDNDKINPLIDVTFDGVRILDGDIVSPSPMIKVSLSDDNDFLLLKSQEDFELVLLYPDGTLEQIDLNSDLINFIPAEEGQNENEACIEFTPELTEGEYTLYVQGKDASGNFSGDQAYTVSFNVYEDDMISNVLNYPNPFSTQTQFIFTLTGSQIPQNYHIKIMTLSGKVVKEITQEELGPIGIGVNRSEYLWNGTDEFGERLANGVYIYKFYTDLANELDSFSLGEVDNHFKKGFGKLVIMR